MTTWTVPKTLPDLRRVELIALDSEENDEGLQAGIGSAWPWSGGYICGLSVAWRDAGDMRAHYIPLRHPNSDNFDRANVIQWLKDHFTSGVRILTQNGLFDYGWVRSDFGLVMPPGERIEELGALATLVDENRLKYGLDALAAWRGLPGKDTTLIREAIKAAGWAGRKRNINIAEYIYRLPAALVGPYAEQDAIATLETYEDLRPILDQENTTAAYRLECELIPMVHAMRRRGIRTDQDAAEKARDHCLLKRDGVFTELSKKLGTRIGMEEIACKTWLVKTFDAHNIPYPRTEKNNPSFTKDWMPEHKHWLPRLIVLANRYNNAGKNFLQGHIINHAVNGRIYSEIHPHKSDDGGTRSLRFSYSNPPLQLMAKHNEELAPLIRGVFLPEEKEVWADADVSQQEYRLIVHYAAKSQLRRADEAVERYRSDPNTDYHLLVADWCKIERQVAKNVNFAKAFGAGVSKFALMTGRTLAEAGEIYARYDRELPFVKQLSDRCAHAAKHHGYLILYDGARRHWDTWEAPEIAWTKGVGPCSREEAERRARDPSHPWFRRWLRRVDTYKAMNALIQGSAARHTKLWMAACWREGVTPMLQMHDALSCSVSDPEQARRVAQLGREVIKLEVPIEVDLKFGRSWGDAKHTWEALTQHS
jgi:DNA polymerase I-like protein with 3'-5' exonuclease and polymerase domains